MTTALEQQREDAALGAAWRHAQEALPEGGGSFTVFPESRNFRGQVIMPWTVRYERQTAFGGRGSRYLRLYGDGDDLTAALEALAEKLAARQDGAE